MRIETPDLPNDFLVVDAAIPASYLVRPAQRIFMESMQSSRLTQIFVPVDSDDPCPQWQAMAEVAGIPEQNGRWHCEMEGRETVEGRGAARLAVVSPRDEALPGSIRSSDSAQG